jgi:viroplasmin and RNaseH domain-containing protein
MAQAQKTTPGTSPETSRSTTEPQGMDGMQELCEELQRQLQSITRDRDVWKETAESATKTGNKGERRGRSRSIARDDSSVMSDMSDQKMLLQQAIEYRNRRDSKKSSSIFSFGQRASKVESDPGADESDREQLIDQLTEAQEQNQQTISQLKTEVVELNRSLKEDVYSSKKRSEVIEQENAAYELKVMVLEQELERLSSEASTSQGPQDTEQIQSLQRDLNNFQNEKKNAEQEIALLQTDFDKLHRASTQEVVHKQTEIDHLKTLQADFQAKIDALENMMLAIDKENETLREIAQKAGSFSIDSDLGKVLAEDDKDVKIAQLHDQLIKLRMQGHQQLADKVLHMQDEKRQMQAAMEEHFQIVAEENETLLEDLEMRLGAREQTIKQLESVLDQINGVGVVSLSGTSNHSGESR